MASLDRLTVLLVHGALRTITPTGERSLFLSPPHDEGVQVNSVLPGAVMTARRRAFLDRWAAARRITADEAVTQFLAQAHFDRLGQPQEIADLLAFLVSPAAKWMTGTALRMDGGEYKGI